jgi:hypothetical protein
MWKLIARGKRGTPFEDLGQFASIGGAARRILEIEDKPSGAIFFRVYVDPINPLFDTDDDAATLSHLEYQSVERYYQLTRDSH